MLNYIYKNVISDCYVTKNQIFLINSQITIRGAYYGKKNFNKSNCMEE